MGLSVNGCCCLSLQNAGLIHGWIGIIFFSFAISITINNIINNSYEISNVDDDSLNLSSSITQELIYFVLYSFDILISGLLIAGITKNKNILLVPWLILRALGIIIAISVTFIYMVFAFYVFKSEVTVMTLICCCVTGFFVWSWIVIYSLYQEISKKQNNVTTSTPSTLPHCESQSRPDDDPPPYHLFAK